MNRGAGIIFAIFAAFFWFGFLMLDMMFATATYSGWGSRVLVFGLILGTGIIACTLTFAARQFLRRPSN